ncbi:hypothetical protein BAY1663_05092 [Pseudomonas sp. BAY1663]|nr:hypothetical protein BAY1663_05092 [Pseudomonas sp. BAY1663]
MIDQRARHTLATQLHHLAAQPLGQLLGGLEAPQFGLAPARADIHMNHRPGQMPALRHPRGMAYQAFGGIVALDAHQQASANRRGRLALQPVAAMQVGVHPRGGRLHRQLAQGGQVGLGEECIDGRAGLLRHVDLAFA